MKTLAWTLIWIGCFATAVAAADDPQKVFDDLFGDAFRTARASRELDDDIALIERIHNTADALTDAKAVRLYLYERACDMAVVHDETFDQAIAALDQAQKLAPERIAEWDDKRLDAWNRHFRSARGDREAVGKQMVEVAGAIGTACMNRGDYTQASTAYRQALSAARMLRLPSVDMLDQAVRLAGTRAGAQRRIETLNRRYEQTSLPALADQIIQAYVIDLDDPVAAAGYAKDSDNADYQANLPLAAKPVVKLDGEEAAQVGRWYQQLADDARPETRPAMLIRARDALAHAAKAAQAGTLAAVQLQNHLDTVEAELAEFGGAANITSDAEAIHEAPDFVTGRTYDLMPLIDVERDVLGGKWRRAGQVLHNQPRDGYLDIDELSFPVKIDGSYQVSLLFSIDASVDGIWVNEETWLLLPVGDGKRVSLRFPTSYYGPQLGVGRQPRFGGTALQITKPQRVSAQVRRSGEKVAVTVVINDRKLCEWTGPANECHDSETRGPKDRIGLASREVKLSLAKLEVKMLDGTMTRVRKD